MKEYHDKVEYNISLIWTIVLMTLMITGIILCSIAFFFT